MKKILSAAVLCLSFAAAPAFADPGTPGAKGTAAAYAADDSGVIDSEACPKTKLSWDYTVCGKSLRDRVKKTMCAKGPGNQPYLYQLGDGKKMKMGVYCPKK